MVRHPLAGSERDNWFEELERRGIDDVDAAPEDMQDERWWGAKNPDPAEFAGLGEATEVRVLSDAVNSVVVHVQGRRYPGLVVQGDRLCSWLSLARIGDRDSVEILYDEIERSLNRYDRACVAHGALFPDPERSLRRSDEAITGLSED
jgi:hypothetical protein